MYPLYITETICIAILLIVLYYLIVFADNSVKKFNQSCKVNPKGTAKVTMVFVLITIAILFTLIPQ